MPDAESSRVLRLRAYAKVNLALEVIGRRPDGFHEVVSVTQTISLHDTLEASQSDRLLVLTDPPVVSEGENLVARAAEALAATSGREATGHLLIRKRTPLAAGLGGGSSDAATALRLLDRLWQAGLEPSRLTDVAAGLGSDVPLFLKGGTALVSGRGENVEPLPAPPTFWLTLACPSFDVPEKTRALYGALQAEQWSDGQSTGALAEHIRAGGSVVDAALVNTFDVAAAHIYPDFLTLRSRLADAAGTAVHLTGAGPSLFALFGSRTEAAGAARRMAGLGARTFVARSVARRPRITVVSR